MKYTNDSMKFYGVDVSLLEKVAKKYNVDTDPTSRQLPTLLMIENGKETARYPPLPNSKTKTISADYNERKIVKYLEIDSKFYSTSAK